MMSIRSVCAAAVIAAALVAGVSGCGDSSGPQSGAASSAPNTTAAPAKLSWTDWQGARLPVSAVDGPAKVDGDVATGYSHTPQGAVLAAVQDTIRLSLAPDTSWAKVANTLAAPGAGRDTYAVNRALVSVTGPAPAGTAPVVKGFAVRSYTDTRAQVAVAVSQNNALTTATQTVVWDGTDWRLLLPDPGHQNGATPLASLTGYTPMGQ